MCKDPTTLADPMWQAIHSNILRSLQSAFGSNLDQRSKKSYHNEDKKEIISILLKIP